MSFTDPLLVDQYAVADVPFARTSVGANSSTYQKADGTARVIVSHNYGKRIRRTIRLEHSQIVADELVPSNFRNASASIYIVMDVPKLGYTTAQQTQLAQNFRTDLLSDALLAKLVAGEN